MKSPIEWLAIWTAVSDTDPLRRLGGPNGLIAAIQADITADLTQAAADAQMAGYVQGVSDALQAASRLAQLTTAATLATLPARIMALLIRSGS